MPVAPLKLLVLKSATTLGDKVNNYLVDFRSKENNCYHNDPAFQGYAEKDYLFKFSTPRFSSGEGKAVLEETVRGKDLFILVDICNHSLTYTEWLYQSHVPRRSLSRSKTCDCRHQWKGSPHQCYYAFFI